MEIQWALVLFTVVAGTGAWLFAFSMLGFLLKKSAAPNKMETIVSFVLVVVGGCLSVLHLSHAERIMEALNRPTSGIFVEASFVGIICVILAVYFIMLIRNSSERARNAVGVLGMLVCAVFTYACGSSYMMDSRPAWDTIALPLAYFGTAAAAGAGLNLLLKALGKADEKAVSFSGLLAIVGAGAGGVLAAAFLLSAGSYLVTGTNGAAVWAVVLFVCVAVEVVCGALVLRRSKGAVALGTVSCVAGVLVAGTLRLVMWLVGTPILNFFLTPLD